MPILKIYGTVPQGFDEKLKKDLQKHYMDNDIGIVQMNSHCGTLGKVADDYLYVEVLYRELVDRDIIEKLITMLGFELDLVLLKIDSGSFISIEGK